MKLFPRNIKLPFENKKINHWKKNFKYMNFDCIKIKNLKLRKECRKILKGKLFI